MTEHVARSFSNGKAVESIETERSRIILHELEMDWWLLAVCNYAVSLPFLTDLYRVVCRFNSPPDILGDNRKDPIPDRCDPSRVFSSRSLSTSSTSTAHSPRTSNLPSTSIFFHRRVIHACWKRQALCIPETILGCVHLELGCAPASEPCCGCL